MNFTQMKVYVISPATGHYYDRLQTVLERLKTHGFQDVEYVPSVPDVNRTNSLSRTNLRIFEKELQGTRPFLILEDDVQVEHLTPSLPIPEDACALYLGVSMWIYPSSYASLSGQRAHIQMVLPQDTVSVDDHWARIVGMTGGHAIVYRCRQFVQTLMSCIQEHLALDTPHDLILATLHSQFPVYALKKPFFYQDETLGGQQKETKWIWHEEYRQFYPSIN